MNLREISYDSQVDLSRSQIHEVAGRSRCNRAAGRSPPPDAARPFPRFGPPPRDIEKSDRRNAPSSKTNRKPNGKRRSLRRSSCRLTARRDVAETACSQILIPEDQFVVPATAFRCHLGHTLQTQEGSRDCVPSNGIDRLAALGIVNICSSFVNQFPKCWH